MTSRDFGIVTLRSAVAYRRNNTLVPPNNVYVTSTNGAAIFSDTLTISTINVSTINGSGVGGGVSSITAGTNISITGTVSTPIVNVDINSTLLMNGYPIYDNSTITIAAGSTINLSTLNTSIYLDQVSQGITITSGNTTTINGTIMTVNGNLAVLSSAITQQIVTSSITTDPSTIIPWANYYGKYNFVSVTSTLTLPTIGVTEGSVLIFRNLESNTVTINNVLPGGSPLAANGAASFVYTQYATGGPIWVSL